MAGLDPAIHSAVPQSRRCLGVRLGRLDGRVKPGHDGEEVAILTPSKSETL
jgi:hypothetical protein